MKPSLLSPNFPASGVEAAPGSQALPKRQSPHVKPKGYWQDGVTS